MTTQTDRDKRRDEFNRIYEGIPGDDRQRAEKVCAILGYQPHTIRVLRCRTKAYKVIPQAKLEILKRELQREASEAQAAAQA